VDENDPPTWDGVTLRASLPDWEVEQRDRLADAAREGNWPAVFRILQKRPGWVNSVRPGGTSGSTPLHQAAWHGAGVEVVHRLVALGAWRTLRTTAGEQAVDIAYRKGHGHLVAALTPVIRHPVPADLLAVLQTRLHQLIRERAGRLVDEQRLRLPQLAPLTEQHTPVGWFPVPGMTGGFHYELHHDRLMVESWSRVACGSGQRHLIDGAGTQLVEEGFV